MENSNIVLKLNTKEETIIILKKYFQKFSIYELNYYININSNQTIPQFVNNNVYELDEIELVGLLVEHLIVVIEKIFLHKTQLNQINIHIKISFITSSIYWYEIFNIDDTIFITYSYLIRVFDKLDMNLYKNANDVLIIQNKIYDLELLKKLSETIYGILQFINQKEWFEFIEEKYTCIFIEKNIIKFKNNYQILSEPNINFLKNKIPIYKINLSNNDEFNTFICPINVICSDNSFSPYWEKKLIILKYFLGEYEEVDKVDKVEDVKYDNLKKYSENLFEPNPFSSKAQEITNNIISY